MPVPSSLTLITVQEGQLLYSVDVRLWKPLRKWGIDCCLVNLSPYGRWIAELNRQWMLGSLSSVEETRLCTLLMKHNISSTLIKANATSGFQSQRFIYPNWSSKLVMVYKSDLYTLHVITSNKTQGKKIETKKGESQSNGQEISGYSFFFIVI